MQRIDGPTVVIGADGSAVDRVLDKVGDNISNLAKIAAATAGAIASVALVSVLAGWVKASGDVVDEMSKMARQTDSTVLGVQALRRAADLSGVSLETLAQSSKQLNVSIGELTTKGAGPAVQALARLQLTAESFEGLDVDQKFGLIADRIKAMNLSASEQQAILKDLRIEHASILSLLEGGSEAFSKARQDVIDFGLAVSDIDALQVEAANDSITSLRLATDALGTQLAVVFSPIITGIMKQFDEWAKGNLDFKASFEAMIDGIVAAIGHVLDSIEVWATAFRALYSLVSGILGAIGTGISYVAQQFREAVSILGGSGTDLQKNVGVLGPTLGAAATSANLLREALAGAKKEAGEVMPSEGLKQWIAEARKVSEEAARATVEANRIAREKASETTQALSADAQKRLEEQQKAAQASLDALYKQLLTAEQLELMSYQRRMEQLIAFREQGLITQEQYNALVERNNQIHYEKINQAQAQAFAKSQQMYTGLANQIGGLLGNITNAIGSEGKKQFAITKALSLAQAVIKGYEAIVSSYAAGARIGGPPLGAAYAAIAAASTAAQIAALRSTSSNSGGGGGGSSSGGSASSTNAATQPTQTLRVEGFDPSQFYSGSSVINIARELVKYQQDGGRVVIA